MPTVAASRATITAATLLPRLLEQAVNAARHDRRHDIVAVGEVAVQPLA